MFKSKVQATVLRRLSFEDAIALSVAALVTIACIQGHWFDYICMMLRREERYELDEYVGASFVFLAAALFMFVRREWQLRTCLRLSAARERAAQDFARHDHLTGTANRLALMEHLEELRGQDHAILLIDLDGFKAVNDRHGHAAGDAVLKEVSRRLCNIARGADALVARLGGDEFACVVPTAANREVEALRDRVTSSLQRPMRLCVGEVAIGASVGAGIATGGTSEPDDLLHRADAGMYHIKHQRQELGAARGRKSRVA